MSGCQESVLMTPSQSSDQANSQLNLSNIILVSLVAGTSLFIVNTVILGMYDTLIVYGDGEPPKNP